MFNLVETKALREGQEAETNVINEYGSLSENVNEYGHPISPSGSPKNLTRRSVVIVKQVKYSIPSVTTFTQPPTISQHRIEKLPTNM